MKQYISKGIICFDMNNIRFCLADIIYTYNQDESYTYTFIPNYSVIDILSNYDGFQGIPGINLDLRKKQYIRDKHPVFITERVPMSNRIDYHNLLEESGLDYFDPIKYLINTKRKYSGDNLYVISYFNRGNVKIADDTNNSRNNIAIIKDVLDEISKGNKINFAGAIIDDSNRKIVFSILYPLYQRSKIIIAASRERGIAIAKAKGKYKGRKPILVDRMLFLDTLNDVKKGELTPKKAAEKLNISIDKYYRLRKQLQN